MASTFDNDLRLEEMATGENAGSWGTKTNTNLELIADAFGYGTFTIANADTTLTMPDGSDTDNALRSLYLKISSSADLTTTRTLTLAPNTVSKLWYIENNTSGGQTITISQGSGANVSILNGQAKLIATDGAGAGAAVIDVTQDLAIPDLFIDDDLSLQSDGAIINFGADADVSLTHVADTGLRLNAAMALEFRDGDLSINSSADGQLDIDADTKVSIANSGTEIFSIDTSGVNVNTISALDGTQAINIADTTGAVDIDTSLNVDGTITGDGLLIETSTGAVITGTGTGAPHTATRGTAATNGSRTVFAFGANSTGDVTDGFGPALQFNITDTGVTASEIGAIGFIRDGSDSTGKFVVANGGNNLANPATQFMATGPSEGTVFNDGGAAAYDFRVESDNSTHALFVDASKDQVSIGNSSWDSDVNSNLAQLLVDTGIHTEYFGTIALSYFTSNYDQYYKGLSGKHLETDIARGLHIFNYDNDSAAGIQFWPNSKPGDVSPERGGYMGTSRNFIWEGLATFNENGGDYDFRVESDTSTHMLFVDANLNRVGINDSGPVSALTVNGDILSNWGNSGEQKIGIAGRGSNTFSSSEKTLIITGADAAAGAQAMQGGDVIVRGGVGAGNEGLNIYAGHLYLEGGLHTAGVGTESGAGRIYMKTAGYERLNINQYGQVTINEVGDDSDFRVESAGNANAIFVDAAQNTVGIGTNSTFQQLTVNGNVAVGGAGNKGIYFGDNITSSADQEWLLANNASDSNSFNLYEYESGVYQQTRMKFVSGGDMYINGHNNASIVMNEFSTNTDFRVESDGNANMLFVDAGADLVSIGTNSPSLDQDNISTLLFAAGDMVMTGNQFVTGQVPNTLNNNNGVVLLFDFDKLTAGSYGAQFHGQVVISSYTGVLTADFSVAKRYNNSTEGDVTVATRSSTKGMGSIASIGLTCVIGTYNGTKYIGLKKNGGTGTSYLNGFINGGNDSVYIREVLSGDWTTSTTVGTVA